MRGALFGGAVGAIIGAACGALFAVLWLCVDSAMTHDRAWLVGVSSGLVAYAGALIGAFKGLKYIDLNYTKITDSGLAYIAALPKLSGLDIADTRVTNAGLACLKPLSPLDWFRYDDTKITDDAVGRLREEWTANAERVRSAD